MANKIIKISKSSVSKRKYEKLERYAKDMATEDALLLPSILIAQFSKNECSGEKITGKELMDETLSVISKAQNIIGGSAVFLECKENEKIVKFYNDNLFAKFDERVATAEDIVYQQMLTLL